MNNTLLRLLTTNYVFDKACSTSASILSFGIKDCATEFLIILSPVLQYKNMYIYYRKTDMNYSLPGIIFCSFSCLFSYPFCLFYLFLFF